MSDPGFIVVHRGYEPVVGADAQTYELLEPLPMSKPHAGPGLHPRPGFHAMAAHIAPRVRELVEAGTWRQTRELVCTCKRGRARLAIEYVAPNGVRWVHIERGESIPPSLRRFDFNTEPSAWPLHAEPNGWPHLATVTCRRCRRVWVVALTWERAVLVPVRPTYGAKLAP